MEESLKRIEWKLATNDKEENILGMVNKLVSRKRTTINHLNTCHNYQWKRESKEINDWVKLATNDKEENVLGWLIS